MNRLSLPPPTPSASLHRSPARDITKRTFPIAVAGIVGLSGAPALAEPVDDAVRVASTLPPVEVVTRPPTHPLVVVTDPKHPRQPLPASDGADYLKTVPGFTSIRSGGTNGDPVLRGMFGSRLNIANNGVPTLGACSSRMDAPTSYIAPESYDRVTVIKGPQSVLHGPGASAGTVLFERDTPRFAEPGVRVDGSLVGGSFGRADQSIDLSAGAPQGYARITANHAHEQDYRDGNGHTVPSKWDKWNTDAAVGWTPDDHTRVELTAGAGDGYARYAGRGMDGAHFRRESFGLRIDKKPVGDVLDRVEAQVYYNSADHVMDNTSLRTPNPLGSMPMPMGSEVRRRTVGGRVAATLHGSDRYRLVTGVDVQSHRLDARSQRGLQPYSDKPWKPSATTSNVGGFGELTWYVAPSQRLIGGVRLDYAGARDQRATLGGMMSATPNPTAQDERTRTLPSGFARYERDLSAMPAMWYIGIGHTGRFPDYWELFSPKRGPAGSMNAFSSLEPERTTQLDIGARYSGARANAWIAAYAGTVRDFILFNYASSTSQATQIGARILGGEAGFSWRASGPWRIDTSVAYAWGRNSDTGQPLPQIPPLDARVGVEYTRAAWSVGGLWRVVAPQHRYALNEGNVVGKDFGPSAGFAVVSLHAQCAFGKTTRLSVGIDNLFDKAYAEHLNLGGNAGFGYAANTPVTEPGRTLWARLAFRL